MKAEVKILDAYGCRKIPVCGNCCSELIDAILDHPGETVPMNCPRCGARLNWETVYKSVGYIPGRLPRIYGKLIQSPDAPPAPEAGKPPHITVEIVYTHDGERYKLTAETGKLNKTLYVRGNAGGNDLIHRGLAELLNLMTRDEIPDGTEININWTNL